MAVSDSGVVRLSATDPRQLDAIARLHGEILPRSVPARLGHTFMTRFYFKKLPEAGLITCDLYRHAGEYVAFNTYTRDPASFMKRALRSNFLLLCLLAPRVFLEDPRRLRALPDLLEKTGALPAHGAQRLGYWLTFGVQEPYRRLKVDEQGSRISSLLVRSMLDYFRGEHFDRVDGAVERENKSAILFYHSCGFKIEDPKQGNDMLIHFDLATS